MEKVNYNFLLFLGAYKFNACYEPFLKIAAPPPPVLPMPTQLLLRRHHDLCTCISGLEGMLVHIHIYIIYI
jgi:hypothetical protein